MNKRKQPTKIIVIDDMPPEAIAMLQALYSRDPQSVENHIKTLQEVKSADGFFKTLLLKLLTATFNYLTYFLKKEWMVKVAKFMAKFYVGYGHKSIGDCGTTTLFIEQVSLLVCKAIQDHQLYNGQEASTRYIAMDKQEVLNPFGIRLGEEIQSEWMSMYNDALAVLIPYLSSKYPILPEDNKVEYIKAIKAKAFDIARGFLPAGVTSFVSWHTNLRQANDHIKELLVHPVQEVRDVAEMMLRALKDKYPMSFEVPVNKDEIKRKEEEERRKEEERYTEKCQDNFGFAFPIDARFGNRFVLDRLDQNLLFHFNWALENRPRKAELPKQLKECGDVVFNFELDFGSFRDVQRQRSALQPMPLLTTTLGFFQWYLGQLPEDVFPDFLRRIKAQEARISELPGDYYTKQYYIAIGYTVQCKLIASLPSAVYIAELRSGQTVHPTLRKVAQQMGREIEHIVPGIKLYCDYSEDQWSTKRGRQDIVKKE